MKGHLLKLRLDSAFKIDNKYCSRTRIDYGTGHEKTFVMFVCCLFKIGYLVDSDKTAVGLKLFAAYFDLGEIIITSAGKKYIYFIKCSKAYGKKIVERRGD